RSPLPCAAIDAGLTRCLADGGCNRGYACADGQYCFLKGFSSAVQVTLRFRQPEHLDLHVDEPTDAGVCEVYWSAPNHRFSGGCGRSSLDLDSNPGCTSDH